MTTSLRFLLRGRVCLIGLCAGLSMLSLGACVPTSQQQSLNWHVPKIKTPPPPQRKPGAPDRFQDLVWQNTAPSSSPSVGQVTAAAPVQEPLGAKPVKAVAAEPLAPLPQVPVQKTVTTQELAPTPVAVSAPATGTQMGGSGDVHRVQKGETLYSVSRKLGIPLQALIDENDLQAPYKLAVGQELRVPASRVHYTAKGDTIYGISKAYGVDMTQLAFLNGMKAPYGLSVGQPVLIPASPVPVKAIATTTTQVALAPAAPIPGKKAVVTAPEPVPAAVQAPPANKVAKNGPIPAPPPRSGGKFLWPVNGKLVSDYGPRQSGRQNDGINILAPRGTGVRAAENGVVAYSGTEVAGFGRLLLIKHADGWITAYAHNDAILVERGETVKRGQIIARVGSSGNVAKPQLHFEIRKGTRAVDPAQLLEPRKTS